jgi:hypothetical protein
MLKSAILKRARSQARPCRVVSDQQRTLTLGQLLGQALEQLRFVDLAVLQAFVETRPLTPKNRHA